MTINSFVCPMLLPTGERLYAVCTGDPADRASVRSTQIMAASAEECQAFIEALECSRRQGFREGYREGLTRGGELAAAQRGKELQADYDEEGRDLFREATSRVKEFCDGLLASIKAELTGRGYVAPATPPGPCCQAEPESPFQPDPGHPLSGPYSGNDDVDEDSALEGSDLE